MKKVVSLVLLLAFVTEDSHCVKYSFGSCPLLEPVSDFNISKFLGLWYVIEKPTSFEQPCLQYNFNRAEEPNQYEITLIAPFTSSSGSRSVYRSTGYLTAPYPSTPAVMCLRKSRSFRETNVTVFMAETNYVALFTCKNWPVGHTWSPEILSRTPKLDASVVKKIHDKLSTYDIDVTKMSVINQDGCDVPEEEGDDGILDAVRKAFDEEDAEFDLEGIAEQSQPVTP